MVKYKKILILGALFLLLSVSRVSANYNYNSVSLVPSSGTITKDGTYLEISVDSGTDEFIGIDLDMSFTGPVEFVSATQVAGKCGTLNVFPQSGGAVINVECFNTGEQTPAPYNGAVISLLFKATGEGDSTFTFTRLDPTSAKSTGGNYILTLQSSSTERRETAETPKTGLFDNTNGTILLGTGLLLLGISWSVLSSFVSEGKEKFVSIQKESRRKKFEEKI